MRNTVPCPLDGIFHIDTTLVVFVDNPFGQRQPQSSSVRFGEKPDSKNFFFSEGDMPLPVSAKSTYTYLLSDDTTTVKVHAPTIALMFIFADDLYYPQKFKEKCFLCMG